MKWLFFPVIFILIFYGCTSEKTINYVLSAGTFFSIGAGILWYQKFIIPDMHFLYVSFLIFVLLSLFVFLFP